MKLTAHFSKEEFLRSATAEQRNICNDLPVKYETNLLELAKLLEKIRSYYCYPIIITSGYRCPKLNDAIGGSRTSQHLTASAADLTVKVGTKRMLFDCIVNLVHHGVINVGQLLLEGDPKNPRCVHVSLPNNGHLNDIRYLRDM